MTHGWCTGRMDLQQVILKTDVPRISECPLYLLFICGLINGYHFSCSFLCLEDFSRTDPSPLVLRIFFPVDLDEPSFDKECIQQYNPYSELPTHLQTVRFFLTPPYLSSRSPSSVDCTLVCIFLQVTPSSLRPLFRSLPRSVVECLQYTQFCIITGREDLCHPSVPSTNSSLSLY